MLLAAEAAFYTHNFSHRILDKGFAVPSKK